MKKIEKMIREIIILKWEMKMYKWWIKIKEYIK